MIGHITEQAINELRADIVILGIRAIDPEKGLTNDYLPETVTDRAIVKIAQKVILVADHTKFGKVATAFVASLSVVNTIITDGEISNEFKVQIESTGVNLVIAS
jgi:DeoR family transcriptional regulator of aga operon/DeoR family fructose operon transcriptional repressor